MAPSQLPDECTDPECDRDTHVRDLGRPTQLGVTPAVATHEAHCPIHGIVAST